MGYALFIVFLITVTVVGTLTGFVCDIMDVRHESTKIDTDFLNNHSLDSIEDWLTY